MMHAVANILVIGLMFYSNREYLFEGRKIFPNLEPIDWSTQ